MPVIHNIKAIRKSLQAFGRNSRNYKKGELLDMPTPTYRVGANQLMYRAQVRGSKVYDITIQFNDVSYSETKTKNHQMPCRVKTGKAGRPKIMWYTKPSISKNPVMIKSTDPDFRFRFSKELGDEGSLWPTPNSWIRYDARKEDKANGLSSKEIAKQKYYKVTHPQGGSYIRKTPHPKDGGRDFMNAEGLQGYSYPVEKVLRALVKSELVKY